ncbi:hypothetical protein C8R44DRAFT_768356 [Mycena epipterygia]|nr:hypothetical protein C8R44DRAFT_768356 [Mycena epipterygia]
MGVPIQKILPPSSLVRPTRHEVVEYGLLHVRERRAHDGIRPSTRVQFDEGAIPGIGKRTRQKLEVEVPAEVDGEDVSRDRSCRNCLDLQRAVLEAEAPHNVRMSMKNVASALTGSPVEFGEEGTWPDEEITIEKYCSLSLHAPWRKTTLAASKQTRVRQHVQDAYRLILPNHDFHHWFWTCYDALEDGCTAEKIRLTEFERRRASIFFVEGARMDSWGAGNPLFIACCNLFIWCCRFV